MKRMKFSIDSHEIIVNNPSFMVLQMDIISDGVNKHGTEFRGEDIVSSIPKLNNVPINCTIEYGDFTNHAFTEEEEKKQLGVGVVPETNNAKMIVKDGKNFLRINSIIWKYLFPQASEILKRREKVDISIEITPTEVFKRENGIVVITDWAYEAITLLGAYVSPAIVSAQAKVVKYSNNTDYFSDVMIKYGTMFDSFIVPDVIIEECKGVLSQLNNDQKLISFAENLSGFNNYNYKQIIDLSANFSKLEEESSKKLNKELIKNWFSAIIKEKEGGSKVDKIKEALLSKLGENQKYSFHNDEKVFFFDMSVAKHKSINYSIEEVEEVTTVKFSEEETDVIKVKGTDEFVTELGDGQEAEDSISYSIEKYAELISKVEEVKKANQELETKYSEVNSTNETIGKDLEAEKAKYSELEAIKNDLENKVLSFSEIEKDLLELKEYKTNKEEELKSNAINSLYSKYKDFLSNEEIEGLNEKAKDMEIGEFSKEVYSVVLPKLEAKIETLASVNAEDGASGDNLKYTSVPKTPEYEEDTESTLLSRLERI